MNQALFNILGTTYGGDGIQTFGLPDLRGRAATHFGQFSLGTRAGTEQVTLNVTQIPMHTHTAGAVKEAGTSVSPSGKAWATSKGGDLQYAATADSMMAPGALSGGGSNLPHENMHPGLVLNFVIALQGIFPTRN